jgi:hypothetical protein
MRWVLNLTLPGFGGGGAASKPEGRVGTRSGELPNKSDKKAKAEAEEIFKAATKPNEANKALYNMYTKSGGRRTQDRVTTGAAETVEPVSRKKPTGSVEAPSGLLTGTTKPAKAQSSVSFLGKVTRILKQYTGQ